MKRDLRTQDHEPFYFAEKAKIPYIIIYIYDTNLLQHPDAGVRHLQFIYHSIEALNKTLEISNKSVSICYGNSLDIFEYLYTKFDIDTVFSHNESGIVSSWNRDKGISKFCIRYNISWQQSQKNGVVRGLKNRTDWSKLWNNYMSSPVIKNTFKKAETIEFSHPFSLPKKLQKQLEAEKEKNKIPESGTTSLTASDTPSLPETSDPTPGWIDQRESVEFESTDKKL